VGKFGGHETLAISAKRHILLIWRIFNLANFKFGGSIPQPKYYVTVVQGSLPSKIMREVSSREVAGTLLVPYLHNFALSSGVYSL